MDTTHAVSAMCVEEINLKRNILFFSIGSNLIKFLIAIGSAYLLKFIRHLSSKITGIAETCLTQRGP